MTVTFYTRRGCHLCDEAKRVLTGVQTISPFELVEVDIDSDPELVREYGWDVPVIEIGEESLMHRIRPEQVLEALRRV
jgi:glutaredoxin